MATANWRPSRGALTGRGRPPVVHFERYTGAIFINSFVADLFCYFVIKR